MRQVCCDDIIPSPEVQKLEEGERAESKSKKKML